MTDDPFFKYRNKVDPHKGCLLISEPFLPDPNFQRTVILICEHNEDGSFGFILNKPSEVNLEDITDFGKGLNARVFVGGPVQKDTLHFVHTAADYLEGGVEVQHDLHWGGDLEQLTFLIESGKVDGKDFRFFVGYSGWGPEQLEKEIDENSWILAQGIKGETLLRTDSDELWKLVLKSMGGRYEMFSRYPSDPRLN